MGSLNCFGSLLTIKPALIAERFNSATVP